MHASWVVRYLLKEWEDKKNPLAHYAIDHTEAVRERERERGYSNIWNGTQTQVVTKLSFVSFYTSAQKVY